MTDNKIRKRAELYIGQLALLVEGYLPPNDQAALRELALEVYVSMHRGGIRRNRLMSARGAAKVLRVSVQTVYIMAREGRIPHRKNGRHVFFLREELQKHLESRGEG